MKRSANLHVYDFWACLAFVVWRRLLELGRFKFNCHLPRYFFRLVSLPVREALANDALQQFTCSLLVIYLKGDAVVVAEVEFGQIAVQVFTAAMLINAVHAALEDTEKAFNGIGTGIAPHPLVLAVVHAFMQAPPPA